MSRFTDLLLLQVWSIVFAFTLSITNPLFRTGGATPIAARESVVRYHVALRETAYTDISQFSIFIGNYNVNGQPSSSGLADWLAVDDDPPDIKN